jgi:hypothetical protein
MSPVKTHVKGSPMADRKKHFCTCGDLECPCNPNNPSNLKFPMNPIPLLNPKISLTAW